MVTGYYQILEENFPKRRKIIIWYPFIFFKGSYKNMVKNHLTQTPNTGREKKTISSRVSEELDFQQNPFTILKVTLTPLEAKCK